MREVPSTTPWYLEFAVGTIVGFGSAIGVSDVVAIVSVDSEDVDVLSAGVFAPHETRKSDARMIMIEIALFILLSFLKFDELRAEVNQKSASLPKLFFQDRQSSRFRLS